MHDITWCCWFDEVSAMHVEVDGFFFFLALARAEHDPTYAIMASLQICNTRSWTAWNERGITYNAAGKWNRLVIYLFHTSELTQFSTGWAIIHREAHWQDADNPSSNRRCRFTSCCFTWVPPRVSAGGPRLGVSTNNCLSLPGGLAASQYRDTLLLIPIQTP